MGYSRQIIKGISWVAGIRVITRILSFLKTVVIARVLTPSQFGVFGIATLILTLIEILTETGINVFLIQEKENIDSYINTAWVVSIIRGILIGLVIALVAPFVANFFHVGTYSSLILLISLVPVIRGFINPSIVTFRKEMQFNKDFIYNISVFLVETIVTITLVLVTHHVSSLIWGMISGSVFEVYITFHMAYPRPHFEFHKERFLKVLNFGKWITTSTILNYFYQHGDDIAVGRLLGATALGYYDMAYRLSLVPLSDISDVITKVTFPVYVKISEDRKRLQRAIIRSLLFVTLCVVPIGLVLYFFPKQIILLIFGEKWLPAVPALQVLGIFGMIRALSSCASAVFLSAQQQKIFTLITTVGLLGLVSTIVPFVIKWGIVGAGLSALLGTFLTLPFIGFFLYTVFFKPGK